MNILIKYFEQKCLIEMRKPTCTCFIENAALVKQLYHVFPPHPEENVVKHGTNIDHEEHDLEYDERQIVFRNQIKVQVIHQEKDFSSKYGVIEPPYHSEYDLLFFIVIRQQL